VLKRRKLKRGNPEMSGMKNHVEFGEMVLSWEKL
jgi:hypothetical protein